MDDKSIVLDPGAEENGLALMLADLLRQNMEENPEKRKVFNLIKSVVAITSTDAEVSLTLFFNRGNCVIFDGVVGRPALHIEAESETILGLSTVPIKLYLPDLMDPAGRGLVTNLFNKKLKITGLAFHPMTLLLLTNVMSVGSGD
ncbi:MAG: hypothetical protein JRF33_23525 [Deltaproteobacteria bacterium]|nr:hypothetical protein [Deltaproteobacteria bacterium]